MPSFIFGEHDLNGKPIHNYIFLNGYIGSSDRKKSLINKTGTYRKNVFIGISTERESKLCFAIFKVQHTDSSRICVCSDAFHATNHDETCHFGYCIFMPDKPVYKILFQKFSSIFCNDTYPWFISFILKRSISIRIASNLINFRFQRCIIDNQKWEKTMNSTFS